MDQLQIFRDEIDKIDKELTLLFEKRMNIVSQISELKKKSNQPVLDVKREEQLLSKNQSYLMDALFEKDLYDFFKCILEISKRIQSRS